MVVAEPTVKFVAAVPPKDTAVAPLKLLPVMVMMVPAAVGPEIGDTWETTGAVPV